MSISYKKKGVYRKHEEFCNQDVIEYLSSKLNTTTSDFTVISKSVFCNAVLAKFKDVSFIINASATCIEIAFAKDDHEKMIPVIDEIKKWDKLTQSYKPFCVIADKDNSRSLLFESGYQTRNGFRVHFNKYNLEFIDI